MTTPPFTATRYGNIWGPARIALLMTALLLGLVAFVGGVVLAGGVGGHNTSWALCGAAMMAAAVLLYMIVRRVIRTVAGYSVTLYDH